MKLSLVVMSAGKASGQTIAISLPQFLIGRDPQCNLRPASALISKRHCALLMKGAKVFVRDFDSTNGTFINDQPVKGAAPLKNQDILRVGPLSFRVVMESSVPVDKPTPLPAAHNDNMDEDSVAAMLLSLQDADDSSSGMLNPETGSTIMESPLNTSAPTEEPQRTDEGQPTPPAPKKPEIKPESTSSAAKSILEKYARRNRG